MACRGFELKRLHDVERRLRLFFVASDMTCPAAVPIRKALALGVALSAHAGSIYSAFSRSLRRIYIFGYDQN